jgi:hypothetical protein
MPRLRDKIANDKLNFGTYLSQNRKEKSAFPKAGIGIGSRATTSPAEKIGHVNVGVLRPENDKTGQPVDAAELSKRKSPKQTKSQTKATRSKSKSAFRVGTESGRSIISNDRKNGKSIRSRQRQKEAQHTFTKKSQSKLPKQTEGTPRTMSGIGNEVNTGTPKVSRPGIPSRSRGSGSRTAPSTK